MKGNYWERENEFSMIPDEQLLKMVCPELNIVNVDFALNEIKHWYATDPPGIAPSHVKKLLAAIELAERIAQERIGVSKRKVMSNPATAAAVVHDYIYSLKEAKEGKEVFVVMIVDANHTLIDQFVNSKGDRGSVRINKFSLIKKIKEFQGEYVILAHNHPGDDPEPSDADYRVHNWLERELRNKGIQIIDSLIVTESGKFTSMKVLLS